MSTNANELFVEPRLLILKAALNNDINTVTKLLILDPTLINAKTTSTASSILHIAAEAGHLEICDLLLERGHETNPVNKVGKTPYQCTKLVEIQSLLVNAHTDYLCNTFFTSANMPMPNKPFITSLQYIIQCKGKSEYSQMYMNNLGSHSFGFTMLRPAPNSTSGTDYGIVTVFRTDILMTPYYGELLVIHENEQAIQFTEKLANSKNGFYGDREKFDMTVLPQFECRAFIKFLSCGLKSYPFLHDYPQKQDTPDIIEAKKMFIIFGVGGFKSFLKSCNHQQLEYLKTLEDYSLVMDFVKKVSHKQNNGKNITINNEMQSKYTAEEPSNNTTHTMK